MFKVLIILVIAICIRGTLPRYRIDQIIILNWKFFIFILVFFYIELLFLIIIF